jgi:ligand-binding SRPBCC domain-containing protein
MLEGMVHRFTASQWLPYPVPFVFAFLADPHNLPGLMPRWQKARVEELKLVASPPAPATATTAPAKRLLAAGSGSVVDITFRPFPFSPVRLHWKAVISEFAWNDRFCDVQDQGPFASWTHCHSVKHEERGGVPGTLITDDVRYEMKMGSLGETVHRIVLRSQIEKTFAYRQQRIAAIFARISTPLAHMGRRSRI